jgi:P27 family predicted phage terminase small subunit
MARPRTSTATKSIKGTTRPGRETKGTIAEALSEVPQPPAHLGASATAEWNRLAPVLVSLGVLSQADLRCLELLCETLATATDAAALVREEGMTIITSTGGIRTHPAVKVMEAARAQATRLLESFGLTPRARNYVGPAQPAAPADAKPDYFDLF